MTLKQQAQQALLQFVLKSVRGEGLEGRIVSKVADRPGYVTVETDLPTGVTTWDVRCTRVLPQPGLPVILKPGRDEEWEVAEDDPRRAPQFWDGKGSGNVGPHAASHGLGGADPLLLDERQIRTLRVTPTAPESLSVYVGPYLFRHQGTWRWWAGGLLDLASYLPDQPLLPGANPPQRIVVVGLDGSTAQPLAVAGEAVEVESGELTFTGSDVRAVLEAGSDLEDFIPAAAVHLFASTTAIRLGDIFLGLKQLAVTDTAGGGGSAFNPLLPPDTPSASDDEFSADSGLWMEYDPGAVQTVTLDGGTLTLSSQTANTILSGVYQALPAGDFTLTTRVTLALDSPTEASYSVWAGLVLWDDAADPTAGLSIYGLVDVVGSAGEGTYRGQYKLVAYNQGDGLSMVSTGWDYGTPYYLRLRRSGTTLTLDLSSDGLSWAVLTVTNRASAAHMGLGILNEGSGGTLSAIFEFFRYRASAAAANEPCYGSGGTPPGTFTALADTPAAYTGQSGKAVVVKSDESGLEFGTASGGGATTFLDLTDTPAAYVADRFVAVNAAGNALELVDAPTGGGTTHTIYTRQVLADITASGGETSLAVSDIPQTYDHLEVYLVGRSQSASGVSDAILLTINGDTTNSNYKRHLRIDGDAFGGYEAWSRTLADINNANGLSGSYDDFRFYFPLYCASGIRRNFHVQSLNRRQSEEIYIERTSGQWLTTAVTSLSFTLSSAAGWTAGTRCIVVAVGAVEVAGASGRLPVATDDVSTPPADAELDAALGTPDSVGAGYTAILDDGGTGTAVYLAASDGTHWWYTSLTKAT